MADSTTVEVVTNAVPNSCIKVGCDCNTIWSMAQQFSYLRLCDERGPFKASLIKDYAVRARRIAGTYARFYLEAESGGDATKKGRFYWMALGAFASKTVACTLETWQLRTQAYLLSKTTKEGLGKGNFWLFCDISGWHWYYSNHPDSFNQCLASRNSNSYVPAVKQQVAGLPWSASALPRIRFLSASDEIKKGFAKVKAYETEATPRKKEALQLAHLLDIADHEQGVILQPLIYDDPAFARWIGAQRALSAISPDLELVFSSACQTDRDEFKSEAPSGTELEDLRSRMDWISAAANQFHRLMRTRKSYMEAHLSVMAGWTYMADR